MSQTNNLLFAVGNITSPQEGAAALLASVVIQSFHDMIDIDLSRDERRSGKACLEEWGNDYLEDTVGKKIPMEQLVTC